MKLTLTKETDKSGQVWIWVRQDGNGIKCFDAEYLEDAKVFFDKFKEGLIVPGVETLEEYDTENN